MARPRPARRPIRAATIALRLVSYLIVAWGTIATLAAGSFPRAALVTLGVAIYTTLPLAAFIRWRGWPFYSGAAFRLLIVRPFWYTQLMLPLVAGGGLIGLLVGLPFGHPVLVGRVVATTMLAIVVTVLVLGYIGSRRLVVRQVDIDVPGSNT